MAIARINSTQINGVFNTNPIIITIPATGTGNLIVLLLNHEASSNTDDIHTTSVTDNVGNTYQAVPNSLQIDNTTQGASTEVWYAANSISGATSVTITCNMTIDICHGIIAEYSGIIKVNPVLDGQHAESTGTPSLGPVLTTSDPNSLLVTLLYKAISNASGVNAPWDAIPYSDSNFVELLTPGSIGTYQAVFTPAQTDLYLTSGAVFSAPPIIRIQTVNADPGVTNPVTIAATGTGNLIVIGLTPTSPSSVVGITDNVGNTYVAVPGARASDGSNDTDIWYAKNSIPGATSVSFTGSIFRVSISEYSGANTSNPLGMTANVTASGSPVSPNLTNSDPNALLFVVASTASSDLSGTSAPWENLRNGGSGTVADYLPGIAGTFNASFLPTTSQTYFSSGAVFVTIAVEPTSPWESSGPLDVAKAGGSVVRLTTGPNVGKLLTVGGFDFGPQIAINSCSLYDASSKTWSATGSLNVQHGINPTVLLADGTPLTMGGLSGGSLTAICELYDPIANTWSVTGPLHVGRYASAAILLNDGTVLCGGGLDTGAGLFSWEIYDPIAKTWSFTGSTALARGYIQLFKLPDGTVLAAGGYGDPGYPSTCEIYDPIAKTWSLTGSLSQGRSQYGSVVLPDGTFLIAGGGNSGGNVLTSETFDPTTKLWTLRGSTTNFYVTGCCDNLIEDGGGDFFIIGGGALSNLAEKYNISTHTWSDSGGSLGQMKSGAFFGQDSNGFIVAAGGENPLGHNLFSDSAFGPTIPPLTLNLSDSISASDSMTDAFSIPLSDNIGSSDSAPNSFSVQSDFIAPAPVPEVEQLVNELIPASVKTYFRIVE